MVFVNNTLVERNRPRSVSRHLRYRSDFQVTPLTGTSLEDQPSRDSRFNEKRNVQRKTAGARGAQSIDPSVEIDRWDPYSRAQIGKEFRSVSFQGPFHKKGIGNTGGCEIASSSVSPIPTNHLHPADCSQGIPDIDVVPAMTWVVAPQVTAAPFSERTFSVKLRLAMLRFASCALIR